MLVWRAFSAATVLFVGAALAAPTTTCLKTRSVSAVGLSSPQVPSDERESSALAEALADAIAQTRGTFVSASSELTEVVREEVSSSGGASFEASSTLKERISQRVAGFVPRYSVLSRDVLGNGLVKISIQAEVCLDSRIGIALSGDRTLRDSISGSLAEGLNGLGWHPVILDGLSSDGPGAWFSTALSSGLDYIATGDLAVHPGNSRSGTSAIVATVSVELIDIRTLQIVQEVSVTLGGVGRTQSQAIGEAGKGLAIELAQQWTRKLGTAGAPNKVTFLFKNVSRPGTRLVIGDLLKGILGVIQVTALDYNLSGKTVTAVVDSARDACSIAQEFVRDRSLVSWIDSCSGGSSVIVIDRE